MICDQCRDIEQIFNEKDARKQLKKYRKRRYYQTSGVWQVMVYTRA